MGNGKTFVVTASCNNECLCRKTFMVGQSTTKTTKFLYIDKALMELYLTKSKP